MCACSELPSCSQRSMMPRKNARHLRTPLRHRSMKNCAISPTQASPPTASQCSDRLYPHYVHRHHSLDIDTALDSLHQFMTDDRFHQIGSILHQRLTHIVVTITSESRHDLETLRRRQEGDPCRKNIIDPHHHLIAITKSRTWEDHLPLLLREVIHLHITIRGETQGDHHRLLTAAMTVNTMEDVHHGQVRTAHRGETGITDRRDRHGHLTKTRSTCVHTVDLIRCRGKRIISSRILHTTRHRETELIVIVDLLMQGHLPVPHIAQQTMTTIQHTDIGQGTLCSCSVKFYIVY